MSSKLLPGNIRLPENIAGWRP